MDRTQVAEIPGSFEEFSRQRFALLKQKSNVSVSQVEQTFKDILEEMGLRIRSLEVKLKRAQTLTQVTFNESRDVVLEYDDYFFRTLDQNEIRAVLTHEACHVATLPDTNMLVSENEAIQSFQSAIIESYDEFLAHEEFHRRFSGKDVFFHYREVKLREFSNYALIVQMVGAGLQDPAKGLYAILNDAIYFLAVGNNDFTRWCVQQKLEGLSEFLGWIIEDFRYLKLLNLKRFDTMNRLNVELYLSLGVDGGELLAGKKPRFMDSASEAEKRGLGDDPTLAEAWQKRRLAAEKL